MAERVTVFIDGANLYKGLCSDCSRHDIDLGKLAAKLVGSRDFRRAYYYIAMKKQADDPDGYQKQQSFISRINKIPYFKVVLGRLEKRGTTYVEKGVDIALAVDMLALVDTYDTAVLVSGDGDFAKVVEYVQARGKHVESYAPKSLNSYNLSQIVDLNSVLDDKFLTGCWLNYY